MNIKHGFTSGGKTSDFRKFCLQWEHRYCCGWVWMDVHKWLLFCVQFAAYDNKQGPSRQDLFLSFYWFEMSVHCCLHSLHHLQLYLFVVAFRCVRFSSLFFYSVTLLSYNNTTQTSHRRHWVFTLSIIYLFMFGESKFEHARLVWTFGLGLVSEEAPSLQENFGIICERKNEEYEKHNLEKQN